MKKLLFVYFTDKSDLMIRRLFRLLNLYTYLYVFLKVDCFNLGTQFKVEIAAR